MTFQFKTTKIGAWKIGNTAEGRTQVMDNFSDFAKIENRCPE